MPEQKPAKKLRLNRQTLQRLKISSDIKAGLNQSSSDTVRTKDQSNCVLTSTNP